MKPRTGSYYLLGAAMTAVFLLGPVAAPASDTQPLTLDKCLDAALSGNRGIEALRHRVDVSAAKVDETLAKMGPKLFAVGKYLAAGEQQRLWPARYDGEKGVYDDAFTEASVVLEIPLWDGGKTRHRTMADRKLLEAARSSLERQEQKLRYDVERLFFMALSVKESIGALEASLESLIQHEEDVQAMVDSGKAARVDTLRMDAEVALTRERLLGARHELESLKEDLLFITGIDGKGEDFDLEGPFPETPDIDDLSLEVRASKALEKRPDYKAALDKAAAGKEGVLATLASKNPEFFLRGLHGYRGASNGARESRTDVELAVEIPLLDGGLSSARRRQAASEAAATEAEAREMVSRVYFEVSEAVRAYEFARERIIVTEAAVRAAEEALRIEKLRFRLGKGTTTDVLSSQAAWLSARAGRDAALAEGAIAAARLTFAMGGGSGEY